jgi:hypothetical protein
VKRNVNVVEAVILKGVDLRVGDRVNVKPRTQTGLKHSDLTARVGIIEAFEQHEGQIRVSVVEEKTLNQSLRLLLRLDEIEPILAG